MRVYCSNDAEGTNLVEAVVERTQAGIAEHGRAAHTVAGTVRRAFAPPLAANDRELRKSADSVTAFREPVKVRCSVVSGCRCLLLALECGKACLPGFTLLCAVLVGLVFGWHSVRLYHRLCKQRILVKLEPDFLLLLALAVGNELSKEVLVQGVFDKRVVFERLERLPEVGIHVRLEASNRRGDSLLPVIVSREFGRRR
jgi:hypothetical protein